ncbi:MAG: hypothetical protein GWN71_37865, partial [Gammaproteobacteria bacterium]|nr:hypothetical protein [Gemmatimonadota bacterium]NIU79116.1 hypothetical protein [Gammaproteobacteria bacterium]NIY12192.1 hypothetical protein [Gemmatimonadota bacterium]
VRDRRTGENTRIDLPEDRAAAQVLSEKEVLALAALGLKDEQHYGMPQDA